MGAWHLQVCEVLCRPTAWHFAQKSHIQRWIAGGAVGIDPIKKWTIYGLGLVKDPNDRGLYPQLILDNQYNQYNSLDF